MKTKSLIFLLLLFLTSNVFAQNFDFNVGSAVQTEYNEQIVYETLGSFIIIPVTISGKTYRFLFDSGSSNILSKELFEELNPIVISQSIMKDASARSQSLSVVDIDNLSIGAVAFKGSKAYVIDINSTLYKGNPIDGIIGSCLFRESVVQIDKENKRLVITNDPSKLTIGTKDYTKIKLSKRQSLPYIKVKVNGKGERAISVLIDTGSSTLLDVSYNIYGIGRIQKIVEVLGENESSKAKGFYGSFPNFDSKLLSLPELEVNNITIHNVVSRTTPNDNNLLGIKLLDYGIVTIDYRNKRFYFK